MNYQNLGFQVSDGLFKVFLPSLDIFILVIIFHSGLRIKENGKENKVYQI